ncbi:hypothetical protein Xoosp13_52 [Xanthomonas phage Xoo-sp13]|nr:hypothetical protein Xoosp13_52 [Xanthomonas phage Xoo-sp13]
MQYCKVVLIPPDKNIILIKTNDGQRGTIERSKAMFLRVGDVFTVQGNKFKLLTDDDDVVIMSHPDRRQLVPYGFFGPKPRPPEPIQTPRS